MELKAMDFAEVDRKNKEWNANPRPRIGHAILDRRRNCIILRGPYDYEVDLDRCKSNDDILNWIMHIAGKTWADPRENPTLLGDLVLMLRKTVYKFK
jgi:hypothetical protein